MDVLRMPRVRFTVRQLIALVFCLSLLFHCGVTAWRVYVSSGEHIHTAVLLRENWLPGTLIGLQRQPFWPAYWRRLTGLSGGVEPSCRLMDRCVGEMCELVNP